MMTEGKFGKVAGVAAIVAIGLTQSACRRSPEIDCVHEFVECYAAQPGTSWRTFDPKDMRLTDQTSRGLMQSGWHFHSLRPLTVDRRQDVGPVSPIYGDLIFASKNSLQPGVLIWRPFKEDQTSVPMIIVSRHFNPARYKIITNETTNNITRFGVTDLKLKIGISYYSKGDSLRAYDANSPLMHSIWRGRQHSDCEEAPLAVGDVDRWEAEEPILRNRERLECLMRSGSLIGRLKAWIEWKSLPSLSAT